ncbi:MAG TPA: aromatic ring-hydroxylating dioxygenase subunit alpha [Candidatus Cybelea sp.]|nr:aromatic ring-hydroxylating dioxygenase subunit alpha [Candidatus Cybelea sp.]
MGFISRGELQRLVEPDRVHRSVYVDPAIFDMEMERVFGRAWIYVGHESQVPKPGDYITALIGRQPVVMVRHTDGAIHVLYNRCGHKGAVVVGERCGNAKFFRCCYHGWTYKTDGSLLGVPLRTGYEGTSFDTTNAAFWMAKVPRVQNYRGFVFASLADHGLDLKTFLGTALSSLDDMVDRAPEGQLEIAGGCFRILQRSNWKIFMENLNDLMHPMIVHESSVEAARQQGREVAPGEPQPLVIKILAGNGEAYSFWERLGVTVDEHGHSFMGGIVSPRSNDPVFLQYVAAMEKNYGKERTEKILSVNRHNTIFYPSCSVQASFQQMRVIRPLAIDRTLVEVWNFRLKGAPEAMYQKTLLYSNVVNSPSSIVMPDDLEAYNRVQVGLGTAGSDWVSLHRDTGRDRPGSGETSAIGTSELPMRNQFRAWLRYMTAEA